MSSLAARLPDDHPMIGGVLGGGTGQMKRHGEADVIPVVMGILQRERSIRTSELVRRVPGLLPLTRADRAPLKNRRDTKITQVIRNLVSHRTLDKRGLATYANGVLTLKDGK